MKAEQKHWQKQTDIYYQASDSSKSLELDMFYFEFYDRLDTKENHMRCYTSQCLIAEST